MTFRDLPDGQTDVEFEIVFKMYEISFTRFLSLTLFNKGWNQPLKLNGIVVQREDQDFPRYENAFAKVPWGARVFNISSQHYSLLIDFEEQKTKNID